MSRNYSRRQFLKNNSIAGLGTLSGLGLISDVFAGELNVNQGYQSESRWSNWEESHFRNY